MKKAKVLLCVISIVFIHAAQAAHVRVFNMQSLPSKTYSHRKVTVFWKDGQSRFYDIAAPVNPANPAVVISSPWNRDIVAVEWWDVEKNNQYKMPLHVPTVRAPWAKDAWLMIFDSGDVRFDVGQGEKEHRITEMDERQNLEEKGWAVID